MSYTITTEATNGMPAEARATYGGCWIRILTGYDIVSNQYPVHVFVARDSFDKAHESKQPTDGMLFKSQERAFEFGYTYAVQRIDAGAAP